MKMKYNMKLHKDMQVQEKKTNQIEKEVLIEQLIEREDTIKPDDNRLSVQQKNDSDKAEDIGRKPWRVWEKQESENYRAERLMRHQPTN